MPSAGRLGGQPQGTASGARGASNPRNGAATIRIVLPSYNEEGGLGLLLAAIRDTMESSRQRYEVVVVNDGSTDGTAEVAQEAACRMPVRLVHLPCNQGLACALENGLLAALQESATDDILVTMDADNTHSPALIPQMVDLIQQGHDVVLASRFPQGAQLVGVPPLRRAIGWLGAAALGILFPIPGVREYTCAYRAYRAGVLRKAFATFGEDFISESGFTCMVDVILKLRGQSLSMAEVPLVLRYDRKVGPSKMRVAHTAVQTLWLAARRRLGWT